jgi:hypothetical protein
LNFLDITITKDANKLTYEIYRKPTTSDTIIPKDSCHPIENKLAAVRYFANRIHTYNLDQKQKTKRNRHGKGNHPQQEVEQVTSKQSSQ